MQQYTVAIVVSIFLAILGYMAAVLWSGSEQTLTLLKSLSVNTWTILVVLSLGNYLLRYVRWEYYMANISDVSIPRLRHFLIYISGFALTVTPGKAGEALRSIYIKPYGIGFSKSISILFSERVVDFLSILLLSMLAASYFDNSSLWLAALASGIALLVLLPLIHSKKLWRSVYRLSRNFPEKIAKAVDHLISMVTSSSVLLKNRILYTGLLFAIVAWCLEGIGFYILLRTLDVECSLSLAIGIYSIAILVGAVSFLPGGLGGTEATMILLMIAVGSEKSTAVAATLICRIVTLWFAVLLGFGAILYLANKGIVPVFTRIRNE